MNTQKQHGFSALIIVLSIALVGVIGFVGWRMYDSSQQANNQQNAQNGNGQTQEPTTDPNEGYVVIKEWGVRFKPVEGLSGVEYFRASDTPQSFDRFELSTKEAGKRDVRCKTQGFRTVTRSSAEETTYELLLAKIGNFNYYYRGSDSACSTTSASANLELQERRLMKESLKSLEAAK
jgi:hypothetical protein